MIFYSIKEKFIFYDFPVILFILIPLFLITGPFLSDLSVSMISLIFLIYCLKEKNFSYFKNKYFYFFLLFWGYLILNSIINNFNFDSLKISFFYFRYGVFVIALVSLFNVNDKFIKYFFYCIFFCFTILIFDGFFQFLSGENIFGLKSNHPTRISSFFGDELILGSYLSRLWPIFFGLSIFLIKKKDKSFLFLIVIFILSEVLIFLSGERAAFFYINLSAIFVIFFSQKLLKLRFIILTISLLMIIILSYFNPNAKERMIDKTISQMNITHDGFYVFSRQHTHHYISGFRMFMDNKILGVGVKNFRNFCNDERYKKRFSCSSHPHNFYVQMLSELGIIGFSFLIFTFIYFLTFVFKHFLSKIKGKYYFTDFEICVLSGILIFLWPFVPNGSIFNNWLIITVILYLPFLIWSRELNKE
jgi:O-antigen ligase